nr:uncharacterized protein LOC110808941 [Ipomoea batatas]
MCDSSAHRLTKSSRLTHSNRPATAEALTATLEVDGSVAAGYSVYFSCCCCFNQSAIKALAATGQQEVHKQIRMPHRARPMTGLLVFVGLNAALVSTIEPVYDFVCFLPYWERRRERRGKEREAALAKGSGST